MPEEFPKIGLDSPSDLNHVIQAIKNHANRMVNQHLISLGMEQESKQFQLAQQGIEKSLQEWLKSTSIRIQQNCTVNGLSFREFMSQPSALEPFDEMLSLKVQSLSQNAETITDQVIKARKGIPSRRAEALKRLQKARLELDGLREEERDQHRERLVEKWEEGESQVGGPPSLERSDEVKASLKQAIADIQSLQVSLLERASSSEEQTRVVKRLRALGA